MTLDQSTVVGVIGTGSMGTGIAQVAAAAGHRVVIGDAVQGAASRALGRITQAMEREVAKGRMDRTAADALMSRIEIRSEALHEDLNDYLDCGLVIEAVVEQLDVKQA